MKKTLPVFILFLAFSGAASAQLVHVDGSKTVGISAGIVKDGFNLSAKANFYQKNNLAYRVSLEYERLSFTLSKTQLIQTNPELVYTFAYAGEKAYFNAKAGVLVGVEYLTNSVLDKQQNTFFLGETIGLGAEYYLSSHIMVNLDVDQRFIQLSKLGSTSFIARLGINYNF
jgi:hypothetical protein